MRNETCEHRKLNVDWSIGLFTAVTTIHRFSGRHAPSRRPIRLPPRCTTTVYYER